MYALGYGLRIMKDMGQDTRTIRAGHANMFLSPLFREAFAAVTGARLELYETNGAQGAARAPVSDPACTAAQPRLSAR